MSTPVSQRDIFVPVMLLLVATAWLVLFLWEQSPYNHYILHGPAAHHGSHHHGLTPQATSLYLLGWTLMCVAMMLPTSLPLIQIFRRITCSYKNRSQLVALLIGGYLAVWLSFGIVAHLGQWLIAQGFQSTDWLADRRWLIGPALLLAAGAFQFSELKYRCLDKCRTPLSFVIGYWRGRNERRQSLLLGMHHGLYCLGCCWALMLLMFAVGTGGVFWMLILGALMAAEKNLAWGRSLAMPLGVILLIWGSSLLANRLLFVS